MIVTLSLADFIHPDRFGPMFKGSPPAWRLKRAVSERDIRCALERDDLVAEPYDTTTGVVPHRWHAGRIAYLVKHGWSDPIEVKVVDTTDWPLTTIINGSHRFRAAVYRGDEHINFKVRGDLVLFERWTSIMLSATQKTGAA
jgi:hypothetical protein